MKPRRVVIADAGPLIALARVDSLDLLRALFGRVCITTVRAEILPTGASFPDHGVLARTLAEGWIDTVDPPPARDWQPFNPGIDAGEASGILTACRWRDAGEAVLLIMDDRAGRLEAKAQGIAMVGTAAVIALAKAEGHIPAARPVLERLVGAGYFLGPSVIAAVLAEAGE